MGATSFCVTTAFYLFICTRLLSALGRVVLLQILDVQWKKTGSTKTKNSYKTKLQKFQH